MARHNPVLDLDVDSPEKVSSILYRAAESYRQSDEDLSAAWQDKNAGLPWRRIATILERAAESIDKALKRM